MITTAAIGSYMLVSAIISFATAAASIGIGLWQYSDSLKKSEAISEKYYQKGVADTQYYYELSKADTETYYQQSLADSRAETAKLERKSRIARTAQYGSVSGRRRSHRR